MSQNETDAKYQQLAEEADRLIKAGQVGQVANLVHDLNFAKIPRPYLQVFAKICRRSGLIGQGLRLMHPIIRQAKISDEPAKPGEICEYSSLLSRNGSISEAIGLLEKVDASKTPEASLYLGFCHISKWEYSKAVEFFTQFLECNPDNYSKLIAQVNLASSYIVISELSKASEMLEKTIQLAEQLGAHRLIGNCYELWGQVHFWEADFAKAKIALKRALEIFGDNKSYDQLLIYKTESIMAAIERNSVDPLVQFRAEAANRKHWESVRESDLFQLKVQFNQKQMDHVVFGTPLSAYRQRIEQIVGARPSTTYVLGNENSKCLDLETGLTDNELLFPPGKKVHQVLGSLLRDFYTPRNMGTLFSELYPGEFFNVETSPFRVRQAMMRTRQWLKENRIPIVIEQNKGSYFLHVKENFGIRIHIASAEIDPLLIKWTELKTSLNGTSKFSADQACQKLGWSRSSFRRVADWGLGRGCLWKTGHGKSTFYHFACPTISQNVTDRAS